MKRKPTSLAQVAADYIIGQANALKERLAAVHTAADHHEAHAARIDGKKLRYLLEPFAPYLPDIDPILGQLKRLQDTAGDLHDVQVFTDEVIVAAQRAAATHTKRLALAIFKGDLHAVAQTQQENPIPGILTLAARLRERGTRCFETLKREWLDGAAEDLLNQVHAAAHALRAASTSQCPPLYGDRS
jgi:CHAD domain-containing protein